MLQKCQSNHCKILIAEKLQKVLSKLIRLSTKPKKRRLVLSNILFGFTLENEMQSS